MRKTATKLWKKLKIAEAQGGDKAAISVLAIALADETTLAWRSGHMEATRSASR